MSTLDIIEQILYDIQALPIWAGVADAIAVVEDWKGKTEAACEKEVWTIRICECGCLLGETIVATALRGACPDCGVTICPVEDRTRGVAVETKQ